MARFVFNILDTLTLRTQQSHPEKSTYSLEEEVQEARRRHLNRSRSLLSH
jgi:hypothetical protein